MLQSIKKGFTLIELLIVIAIIGVLAGAVVISLSDETDKATNATVKLNARSVATQALVEVVNETITTNSIANDSLCDKLNKKNALVKEIAHATATINVAGSGANKLGDDGEIGCISAKEKWVIIGRGTGTTAFDSDGNGTGDKEYWCVDHEGHNSGNDNTVVGTASAVKCD